LFRSRCIKMVLVNNAKRFLAYRMISGNENLIPTVTAIGSGSGTALVTEVVLVAEVRSGTFTTIDSGTKFEVSWVSDFSATQMSGLGFREFGLKNGVGSIWNREAFANVVFDGT